MEHACAAAKHGQSLFGARQIDDIAQSKNLRPFAERLILLAVRARSMQSNDPAGAPSARRRTRRCCDRAIIPRASDAYAAMSDAHRAKSLRMPVAEGSAPANSRSIGFTAESVSTV